VVRRHRDEGEEAGAYRETTPVGEAGVPELLRADGELLCAAGALLQLVHTAQLYLGRALELLARQVQGLALGALSVGEEVGRVEDVLQSAAERVVDEARAVGRCLERETRGRRGGGRGDR